MSNIIPAISAGSLGVITLRPLPDVQPFSIRSGYSYESILSEIRVWIRDDLVPYLLDNSAEAIFSENVDTLIDTVNAALNTQAQTVTAALNAAVNEIITADIPVTQALLLAAMDPWEILAPAPSGGDDTAVMNALLAVATATKGTLRLRRGTYLWNLLGPQSPTQATIIGAGRKQTTIKGFTNTSPVVKLRGGSGPVNGGGGRSFTISPATGGGGIALEYSGVCSTHFADVDIEGGSETFAVGTRFHNEDSGDYTEMSTFDGTIENCVQPVQYSVTAGNDSFHGAGVVGGVIGCIPTSVNPVVAVDDGIGLPYGAPFTAQVFITNPAQRVFHNGNNGNRDASFYGTLIVEGSPTIVADGTVRTLYCGEIIMFGGGHAGLGKFFLCDWVNYDPTTGIIFAQTKKINTFNQLAAGTTTLVSPFLVGGEQALMAVTILGPNYQQHFLLSVWQDNQHDTGVVAVLAHPKDFDSTGVGEPVFSWSGNALKVTNPNYSSAFSASVAITPLDLGVYGQSALTQ